MDDFSVYVSEAEVSTGMMVGEFAVIESQDVKNGGVKIVDLYLVTNDVIAGSSSVAPCPNSGFTPPPANHEEKARP